MTSWGHRKITERDLRYLAQQVRNPRTPVKRQETVDVVHVPRFVSGPAGRIQVERHFVCTATVRILEERGYAVLGEDKEWTLTPAGEEWLAAAEVAPLHPVETRRIDE